MRFPLDSRLHAASDYFLVKILTTAASNVSISSKFLFLLIKPKKKIFLSLTPSVSSLLSMFSSVSEKKNKKLIRLKVLTLQSACNGSADVSLIFWK